ncbi:MAG: ABC transporter permease [Gemmatimonadales bacterium]|jgi:ribose/xylose/arabinose/galactoside ABC-type transport system permease subunit
MSAFAAAFFSLGNLVNVALSIAVIGILGAGMTAVILIGGIDLSVGSGIALAGVVAALAAHAAGGDGAGGSLVAAGAAVVAALAVGAIGGGITGLAVSRLRAPSFLVTLALLSIERGLAFLFSSGQAVSDLPAGFNWLGQGILLGVPVPVWLTAACFGGGWFVLSRTVWGRWIYALGGNESAAWLAGIDTRAVALGTYVGNGLLVGLAAVVLTARLGAAVPNAGAGYELDVIAAVVVGGTSLTGGRGTVLGTLAGAVCIGTLDNALNLANVDPYMQRVVVGVVILLAVLGERIRSRGRA